MKTIRKALALCLALALVLTAIPVSNTSAAVKTAKLSKSSVTVAGNATKQQTKSVKVTTNADWKNVKVTASSADKKVATVAVSKKTVKVTAVKKGETKVTVKVTGKKSGEDVSKKLTLKVKVCGAGLTAKAPAELTVGDTAKISVKTTPSTAVCTYDVDKKDVATVSDDGTITAVAAGTAKVVVRTDYGKEKILTVTVKEAAAKMTGIKQTASNEFVAEFSSDVSKVFTKDDFGIAATDGSSTLAIKSVEFSGDGKSAKVVVFTNFVNNTEYKVTCKDLSASFTAKVGAVSRVAIDTASAEQNVETKIAFRLFDADGIDVTNSVELDTTCFVTVTGNYSSANLEKASKATLTMNAIGDVAEVTITYNSNKQGAQDVTATQNVTCVDTKATQGTKLFKVVNSWDANQKNNKSDCAKFYLGLSDSSVSVDENTESQAVYFCATASNGDVINYDSYEVESSNEEVMSVNIDTYSANKFATFKVTGIVPGSAQVNIKATKNGKDTYYTVPVVVNPTKQAVSMTVTIDKPTMSDVKDAAYKAKVRATMVDKNGSKVDGTYSYEIETEAATPIQYAGGDNASQWYGWDFYFTAAHATPKTYTIKITGYDPVSTKTFTKRVGLTVKALPDQALKLTYQIELNRTTVDENPMATWDDTVESRLYATYNGLFAGYVRGGNGDPVYYGDEDSRIRATDDTAIASDAVVYAKLGTSLYNNNLYEAAHDRTDASMALGTTTFNTVKNEYPIVYDVKTKSSNQLAKTGAYTVEYSLTIAGKKVSKTRTFTVVNTVVVPKVTVVTKSVDSFIDSDIAKAFKINVDMNNATSDHESYIADSAVTQDIGTTGTKKLVKTIKVVDNYAGDTSKDWYFVMPVNVTLQTN